MTIESGAPAGAANGNALPAVDALPADVAFLAEHGVPRGLLDEAARRGRAEGVTASEALVAHGLLPAETVYRALAHAIGAPFVRNPGALAPRAHPVATGERTRIVDGRPTVEAAASAPYEPPARPRPPHVIAPRGAAVGRVVACGPAPAEVVVTTPQALQAAHLAANATAIAEEAARGATIDGVDLSAVRGLSPGQSVVSVIVAASAVAAAVTIDGALALFGSLVCLAFLAYGFLKLLACLVSSAGPSRGRPPRLPDAALPVYTVLVPLHREAASVPRLCRALARLDYPRAKLDIKLIVEADDAETADAIRAQNLPDVFELVVAPDGLPRTKPRALNVALPFARGDLLVIYDAEDAPEPDQLRLAAETFARAGPEVGCLQARLSIDNARARGWSGFFSGGFAVEYTALFDVVNPGLLALGLPIPLGGTSNHFRTAALRRVGGWDAWNVTEDADMGLRLAAFGLEIRDLPSTTWEEAPATPANWMAQRARWMKGYVQTLIVHTRAPGTCVRRVGLARTLCAWLLVGGTVAAALLYPATLLLLSGLLLVAVDAPAAPALVPQSLWTLVLATIAVSTCFTGLAIGLGLAFEGVRRRGRRDLVGRVAQLPFYWLFVSFGAWRGLWDLFRRPHHWHKTTHGVARRQRPRGAPGDPADEGARGDVPERA